MSFTNNIYGGVPQSEMVFSTSNISSDNASFINLSVSGYATITNLTTVNWSQPNLNASTIVTDALVVTNTSAVNLDVSGVMNVSDLNISDLNVSDISVSTLNVGDIVIDEAEVTTLRFDDVTNANYSEIQRDNDTLTIAGGYVNGVGTQFNGDIAFTPYNLSNATPPSMVVQASDGKVYIPNMSALDINTSNMSVISTLQTSQLTATGLAQFESTLAIKNPASQSQNFFWNATAFQLGNLATVDFNIGNNGAAPDKGIIVKGGINSSVEIPILTADNLSSTLANISTLNVSTINIADIDVPLINTSQLNASNISVDVDLHVVGTTRTDILQADILSAGCDMTGTLETSTNMYYPNNLLIDYSATQVATTIELSSNLSLNDIELLPDLVTTAVPTFSMLSGTAQITNANISTLTCDLTSNIAAGAGISVTSVAGIATITATGGSATDPLNISQLNASNISVDNLSVLTSMTSPLANVSLINASDMTTHDLHVSGGIFTSDNATVFGNTSTATLTCDLTPNLTAGTGITITSVGGKPTITATGGGGTVPDPLNLSQLNASNISVDGDIELIGTSNISANATTATVFKVISENISVSNDISCSNLTRTATLESVGNTSVGFDLSVANDATITGNMRYTPDAARSRRATASGNQGAPGSVALAIVDFPTDDLTTSTITKLGLTQFRCNTAGNYRIICSLNLINTSSTSVNRRSVRYRILINGAFAEADYGMFSSSVYFRGQGQMTEGSCVGTSIMPLLALDTISIQYETLGGGNLENILVRANTYIYIEFMG